MAEKSDAGTVAVLTNSVFNRLKRDEEFCLMVRDSAELAGETEAAEMLEALAADISELVEKHRS